MHDAARVRARLALPHLTSPLSRVRATADERDAAWRKRREEMDTAPRVEEDRPKQTGGTALLPKRHWR